MSKVKVLIRDIDDRAIKRIKRIAKSKGRSLESELRSVIENYGNDRRKAFLEGIRRLRQKYGDRKYADSAPLIREDRDSR